MTIKKGRLTSVTEIEATRKSIRERKPNKHASPMVQLIFEFFVGPIKTHYILLKITSPKLFQQAIVFQLETLQ